MKSFMMLLLGCIIGAVCASAILIHTENKVAVEAINLDIESINLAKQQIEKEAAKYSGGVILSMFEVQKQIYNNTLAFLNAKKNSLIHRVNLVYQSELADQPRPKANLEGLENQIQVVKQEIEKLDKEIARYSGGLVLSMLLVNKSQRELSLVSLEHRLMALKYDFPILISDDKQEETQEKRPQDPVKDQDAL